MHLCLEWRDWRIHPPNLTQDVLPNNTYDSWMIGANYSYVALTNFDQFWIPDIYFRNAVSSDIVHSLRPVRYLMIWPYERKLRLCSQRMVEIICPLRLSNFPFDENHCYFELENGIVMIFY